MEWLNYFDKAFSVAGAIIAALVAVVAWAHRRAEKRDESLKAQLGEASQKDRTRLGRVEAEVKRIDSALTELEVTVGKGFSDVEKRMASFERELMTVARKDDLHALGLAQAKMDSRLQTLVDNDKRLHDMLANQGRNIGDLAAAITKKLVE